MTERLLQFIWQFQYFNAHQLCTTTGEPLQIVQPGQFNRNQGPDFLNAQIRVGNTLWSGHIELHVQASDWLHHRHSGDKNYRNIILHVVWQEDRALADNLYTLELQNLVANTLLQQYEKLMQGRAFIACQQQIHQVKALTWLAWKERLLVERLQQKTQRVKIYLKQTHNDWETVFWWLLARNFGASVNSDAFEKIAQTVPITLLAKNKGQLQQIEALLLGQSGLLQTDFTEAYPQSLAETYRFLQHKYGLPTVHAPLHFLRMRPANFPTVRLAQLAMLIYQSQHLLSHIKESTDLESVRNLLNVTASDYWYSHYVLDEPSPYLPKKLGAQMVNSLLLNTVIPVLYAYGTYHGRAYYTEKAMDWLEGIEAEKNHITKGFEALGIANKTAMDSQALLQLKNRYCNEKRCLDCAVGNQLLIG